MVRRFERTLGVQSDGITNPIAGQDAAFLAQELEAFSARRTETLAQSQAEAGFQAGLDAGMEGERPLDRATSDRDKAFNRGVLISHQAALQTDIRDGVSMFHVEHPNDPDGFDARVEGMVNGLIEEAPPQMHAFIRQRAADYAGRTKVDIVRTQRAELEAQALADLQRGAEGMVEDATTAAREGDVLLLEARRQELEALLQEGVDAGFMDETGMASAMDTFEREVVAQEVLGNVDRVIREKGLEAGERAIERWQATKPSSVGLNPEEHEAVTRQMMTLRNRQRSLDADELARQKAAADAEEKARRGRVNDAIKVMTQGYTPPEGDVSSLMRDLAALEDPALSADFDIAQAIQSTVHEFRRTPALAREQQLQELRASLREGGATPELLALQTSLERTHTEVANATAKDPRGFLNSEGLVNDEPIDFTSADNLVNSIAARGEVGRELEGLVGRPVPLLDAQEAEAFAAFYSQAEPGERINLLGLITQGAGEQAEATIQQLDTGGHTQMAMVGEFVVSGQRQLATDIVSGQTLLATDQVKAPTDLEISTELPRLIGSAYGDVPERRDDYVKAATAKYAQLKMANNDLSPDFDRGLFKQAVRQVIPTASYNGWRVGIPFDVSPDAFEDWTDSWTEETFAALPGDPEQNLDVIRRRGRLTEVGNGRYGILVNSALVERDKVLITEDGAPFILEVPRQP